jgi:hypothetical protein
MLRQAFFLLISSFFLSQSILRCQSEQLPIYEEKVAYEVYSAILSSFEAARSTKLKRLVIRQETLRNFGAVLDADPSDSICLRPDAESAKIIGSAIADHVKVNKMKWRLQEKFELGIPYQLVSSDVIMSMIGTGNEKIQGWEDFYKQYPGSGGFIDFSAVGFNADKTVAVVSKGRWCGPACGAGNYYVLQKKDGKWIPLEWKGERCNWIS